MSVFDFTFGLIAIILGLALTDIASSFHRLVMNRERVAWNPLPLLAAVMALWGIVLQWWTAWDERADKSMTFSTLVFAIAQALTLYLAAAASLPDEVGRDEPSDAGRRIDLGAHYDRVRPWYMGLLAAYVLAAGVIPSWSDWLVGGHPISFSAIANPVITAAFIACIFVRARWFNMAVLGLVVTGLTFRWGAEALRG
jgi:hypothetical protein